jgi:NitT/TauT family transport system substrate-binding protein
MRRVPVIASVLGLALAMTAACGSGGDEQSGGRDQVTAGVIAIADVAPIYLGKKKGFFEANGIDLELQAGSGGAASISGLVSGEFQFAFANIVSLLIAREKGLPLKVISNGVSSTGVQGKDFAAVMVPGDSPIQTAADLENKEVSVNITKNICDTTIRASVRKAGGDPTAVRFLPMEFPDMPAALQKGDVDASCLVEPFVTIARTQGARPIASNYVDPAPDLGIAMYITTEQMLGEDSDLVDRFTEAIQRSMRYASDHPDEVRDLLGEYTEIPPEVAQDITLPKWPVEVNRAGVERIGELARQDGLLKQEPDVDGLLQTTTG